MKTTIKEVLLVNTCGVILLSTALILSLPVVFPAMGEYLGARTSPLKPAKIGIVLAGGDKRRVDGAVTLFEKKMISTVVMSGGDDSWHIAAEDMKAYAISKGIPSENILLEKNSKSTFENAAFTKPIIQKHHAKKIIVITSTTHSKRSLLTFKKIYGESNIDVQVFPTSDSVNRREWWKYHESTDMVLSEWSKLLIYFVKGLL